MDQRRSASGRFFPRRRGRRRRGGCRLGRGRKRHASALKTAGAAIKASPGHAYDLEFGVDCVLAAHVPGVSSNLLHFFGFPPPPFLTVQAATRPPPSQTFLRLQSWWRLAATRCRTHHRSGAPWQTFRNRRPRPAPRPLRRWRLPMGTHRRRWTTAGARRRRMMMRAATAARCVRMCV